MPADERYPSDRLYHPEHDWALIDPARPDVATFGVTWFAQDALGEIVFCDLPAVGMRVSKDETYTEMESVKAVSDVIAPLSGEVIEVNQALAHEPSLVNASPYGDGWIVRVRLGDPSERERLLDAAAYRELLA
ncbi:glycine cleavage system protein GcvH [Conexibacter arvalis]|uniref:Glycine cleavage system H protein n=1 Tax=Conexibacter arvalis TaxID=912552 RepID=A0A840I9D2_9ACTN|nr:glycine cleavage system protein GcvH [Conexibacter arvalis]MBB4660540.1 glycine cleavage system H protein [Conexibacter arvalis]